MIEDYDYTRARRSLWLALLCIVLPLVLVAGIIWGSKVSEQRIKIYSSVEACRTDQPAEDCANAFAGAEAEQEKSAPRFRAHEPCEAQYGTGSCSALHDGTGDWFIPAMVGLMLGHALGTGGAPSVAYQPVYVDRNGSAYSGTSLIGSYRSRCAVNPEDPYCRSGGGYSSNWDFGSGGGSGGGGGFVYASRGSSSGIWSSKSYSVESVRTTVMRGGFGSSASSAPSYSPRVASAPNATSSSSVTRGGFGWTAAFHSSGG